MRRRLMVLVLVVVLVCTTAFSGSAHTYQGHYQDMSRVLFGTPYPFINRSPQKYPDQHKTIWALRYVYQVAVDQFNWSEEKHSNEEAFTKLSSLCGLHHLPSSIAEIDLPNVNSITHRKYTHMGWNMPTPDHPVLGSEWTTRWAIRKNMILATAEQKFNFNGSPDFWDAVFPNYTKGCDAFCAILYYVHLLGDHIGFCDPDKADFGYGTYIKEIDYILPLSGTVPDPKHIVQCTPPNIISEIIYYCHLLFGDDAKHLIEDLLKINRKIENLRDEHGQIPPEAFDEYIRLAKQVLDVLAKYVPDLLNDQKWWTNVFPTTP